MRVLLLFSLFLSGGDSGDGGDGGAVDGASSPERSLSPRLALP